MKRIAIIDSNQNKKYWLSLLGGCFELIFPQEPFIDAADKFIVVQEFANERLSEIISEIGTAPIAVITDDTSIENQEKIVTAGADDIIYLPVYRKFLLNKINSLSKVPDIRADIQPCDFSYFTELARTDDRNGAYAVSQHDFAGIYLFVMRLLERLDKNAQMLIFTISGSRYPNDDHIEAKEMLYESVKTCLRRGDITSVCGKSQILVILMGSDGSGAKIAVERIEKNFSQRSGSAYTLSYDIREMKAGR